MTAREAQTTEQWVAVNDVGGVLAEGFDMEDEAWDWLEARGNYTGFAEPAEWHEVEA